MTASLNSFKHLFWPQSLGEGHQAGRGCCHAPCWSAVRLDSLLPASIILMMRLALHLYGHSVRYLSGSLTGPPDQCDDQLEGQAPECLQQPQPCGRW
jgi:hypothetical protein